MSLFLGNLSPHIRQEELERVFRRFGRSNVQLKDGYGFVIYDVPADAVRALRSLRGKIICGEQIFLTWSNKQPRPFKKFTRITRFSQPRRERNSTRVEDNDARKSSSHDQRDLTAGAELPDKNRGLTLAGGGEDIEEHGIEKSQNLKEVRLDNGTTARPNSVENDRWGAPPSDTLNDVANENGTDFDRYEPYHGYDGRDENENCRMNSSPERAWKENPRDHSKPHICFNCGLEGHIMRNCPQPDSLRREKFRFVRRRDDEINFGDRGRGRVGRAWGSRNARGERPSTRWRMIDRTAARSGKLRSLSKKRQGLRERKENWPPRARRDSCGKKSRKDHETPKKRRGKKMRSDPLQPHSDSSASSSRLHSASSKSVSGVSSRSHSRSISSRSYSESSSSRSPTRSSSSRPRSRSRSSSSRSLSLSISLGRQSPSPPNETQMDAICNSAQDQLEHVMGPESTDLLLEPKFLEGDITSDHLATKVKVVSQKDENTGCGNDTGNQSTLRIEYSEKISCVVPQEEGTFTADNSSSENFREMGDLTGAPLGQSSPQIPMSCQATNLTRISSQDMCMVLKHYSLKVPEENEVHLPVDTYFGAARFWPWEIIYYRRLKKGPISTENYARRVAQNTEFGIVDKYIRSSSGWGESVGNDS